MSPLAQITTSQRDGVVVVAVTGEVDISNAAELRRILLGLMGGRQDVAVLDLSGVTYLDSSGVELLTGLRRALAHDGVTMHTVVPATSPLRRLLDVAGMPTALPVHESLADVTGVVASSRLAATFATLAARLYKTDTLQQTLQRIAGLAVTAIDGTDHAGLSLMEGGRFMTGAATDAFVELVDDLQHTSDDGPGVDAVRMGSAVTGDLSEETRWPSFAPQAAAHGVLSAMAHRLTIEGDTLGTLNLYAMRRHAFDAAALQTGSIFAAHAAVALSEAKAQDSDRKLAENLRQALLTRDVIGQAKGILMEREHVTADEAFDLLRRASQDLNVKLSELAEQVVTTGRRPLR